jgi:hypothetical protein
MAAPFTTEDYQNLIIILQLSPTEIAEGSLLREKGTALEEIDEQNLTDFVGQVQTAIAAWITANDEKNAIVSTDTGQGIKRQKVDGEYEVEYGTRGALSRYDSYEMRKRQAELDIRRLLQWEATTRYVSFNTRANA